MSNQSIGRFFENKIIWVVCSLLLFLSVVLKFSNKTIATILLINFILMFGLEVCRIKGISKTNFNKKLNYFGLAISIIGILSVSINLYKSN